MSSATTEKAAEAGITEPQNMLCELACSSIARARAGAATARSVILGRVVQARVYCDDMLIFFKTREEHLVHVTQRMVLRSGSGSRRGGGSNLPGCCRALRRHKLPMLLSDSRRLS